MSVVYFIRALGMDTVKIGFSVNPARRLEALQCGSGSILQIVRSLDGGRETEAWLHAHFNHARINREWFRWSEEMLTVQPPSETARTSQVAKKTREPDDYYKNMCFWVRSAKAAHSHLDSEASMQAVSDLLGISYRRVRSFCLGEAVSVGADEYDDVRDWYWSYLPQAIEHAQGVLSVLQAQREEIQRHYELMSEIADMTRQLASAPWLTAQREGVQRRGVIRK